MENTTFVFHLDSSTESDESIYDGLQDLPLFGWPGPIFFIIHVAALVCLLLSITVGAIVLASFFRRLKPGKDFWSHSIGDRLMVYLVLCDVLQAIGHLADHSYLLIKRRQPPDTLCQIFGYVLGTFSTSQYILILYTSVSACLLVVFDKKLKTGRRDWRLLVVAFGLPAAVGAFGIGYGFLGQSGAWCFADIRTEIGRIYSQVFTTSQMVVVITIFLCYMAIGIYMVQSARRSGNKSSKRLKTIKSMMAYVLAFFFQWWPLATITIWGFFGVPHVGIIIAAVIVINRGACYNAFAYVILRRQTMKAKEKERAKRAKNLSQFSTQETNITIGSTEKF